VNQRKKLNQEWLESTIVATKSLTFRRRPLDNSRKAPNRAKKKQAEGEANLTLE